MKCVSAVANTSIGKAFSDQKHLVLCQGFLWWCNRPPSLKNSTQKFGQIAPMEELIRRKGGVALAARGLFILARLYMYILAGCHPLGYNSIIIPLDLIGLFFLKPWENVVISLCELWWLFKIPVSYAVLSKLLFHFLCLVAIFVMSLFLHKFLRIPCFLRSATAGRYAET